MKNIILTAAAIALMGLVATPVFAGEPTCPPGLGGYTPTSIALQVPEQGDSRYSSFVLSRRVQHASLEEMRSFDQGDPNRVAGVDASDRTIFEAYFEIVGGSSRVTNHGPAISLPPTFLQKQAMSGS